MEFHDKHLVKYSVDLRKLLTGFDYVVYRENSPDTLLQRKIAKNTGKFTVDDALDRFIVFELAESIGVDLAQEVHLIGGVFKVVEVLRTVPEFRDWEFRLTAENKKYWYNTKTTQAKTSLPFKKYAVEFLNLYRAGGLERVDQFLLPQMKRHLLFEEYGKTLLDSAREEGISLMSSFVKSQSDPGFSVEEIPISKHIRSLFSETEELMDLLFACPFAAQLDTKVPSIDEIVNLQLAEQQSCEPDSLSATKIHTHITEKTPSIHRTSTITEQQLSEVEIHTQTILRSNTLSVGETEENLSESLSESLSEEEGVIMLGQAPKSKHEQIRKNPEILKTDKKTAEVTSPPHRDAAGKMKTRELKDKFILPESAKIEEVSDESSRLSLVTDRSIKPSGAANTTDVHPTSILGEIEGAPFTEPAKEKELKQIAMFPREDAKNCGSPDRPYALKVTAESPKKNTTQETFTAKGPTSKTGSDLYALRNTPLPLGFSPEGRNASDLEFTDMSPIPGNSNCISLLLVESEYAPSPTLDLSSNAPTIYREDPQSDVAENDQVLQPTVTPQKTIQFTQQDKQETANRTAMTGKDILHKSMTLKGETSAEHSKPDDKRRTTRNISTQPAPQERKRLRISTSQQSLAKSPKRSPSRITIGSESQELLALDNFPKTSIAKSRNPFIVRSTRQIFSTKTNIATRRSTTFSGEIFPFIPSTPSIEKVNRPTHRRSPRTRNYSVVSDSLEYTSMNTKCLSRNFFSSSEIQTDDQALENFNYYCGLIGHPYTNIDVNTVIDEIPEIDPSFVVLMGKRLGLIVSETPFDSLESDLLWIPYLQIICKIPWNIDSNPAVVLKYPIDSHPGDGYFTILAEYQRKLKRQRSLEGNSGHNAQSLIDNSWLRLKKNGSKYYYNFLTNKSSLTKTRVCQREKKIKKKTIRRNSRVSLPFITSKLANKTYKI